MYYANEVEVMDLKVKFIDNVICLIKYLKEEQRNNSRLHRPCHIICSLHSLINSSMNTYNICFDCTFDYYMEIMRNCK